MNSLGLEGAGSGRLERPDPESTSQSGRTCEPSQL
jgi:hypothetical protein